MPTTAPVDELAGDRPLPTTPGDHKLKFRTHIGPQLVEMSYLLHLPPRYESAGPAARHPMLVFLHGSGESGTDLAGIYTHGPMSLLKADGGNADFAASCPFVVLCPQCPPRGQRWDMDFMTAAVQVLVDGTVRRARVDADQVFLTGLSMGGQGTWCVAEAYPDRFAAIAPMNGFGWHPEAAGALLRTTPIWAAVGMNDESKFIDATREMQAAVSPAAVARRFHYLNGNGHDAFWPTYQDPDFFEWLLAHRRPTPARQRQLLSEPPWTGNSPVPTTPGNHFGTWATKVGDQPCQMDYVTYLPSGYDPAKRYPTLLFLREADTIGPVYHDVCLHGPNLAVVRTPGLADRFPFLVVSPHWPTKCDWQTAGMTTTVLGLMDHLAASGLAIDRDRVIATGVNAGANGVWRVVSEAPDRFAAALPIETNLPAADTIPSDQMAAAVQAVPGWAFNAADDAAAVARVTQTAARRGHDWNASRLPRAATPLGDLLPYRDPAVVAWIAQQVRTSPPLGTAK